MYLIYKRAIFIHKSASNNNKKNHICKHSKIIRMHVDGRAAF